MCTNQKIDNTQISTDKIWVQVGSVSLQPPPQAVLFRAETQADANW